MSYIVTAPELKQTCFDVITAGFQVLSPSDLVETPATPTSARVPPLKIGVNDPMDWADFPFIGINQLSDSEFISHIGDSIADELVGFEDEVYSGCSTLFQQHVECKLWCINGGDRDRLGALLKQALFAGRGTDANPGLFLTTDGITLPKISGGADEGISMTGEGFPAHTIYTRTYFVTAVTELTLQEAASQALHLVSVSGNYFPGTIELPVSPP